MTEFIIASPAINNRSQAKSLKLPKLGIPMTILAISESVMKAFALAYVAPFHPAQSAKPLENCSDLEGRDPSW